MTTKDPYEEYLLRDIEFFKEPFNEADVKELFKAKDKLEAYRKGKAQARKEILEEIGNIKNISMDVDEFATFIMDFYLKELQKLQEDST
ncbi:hypothetical protein M0R04_09710 [Candidatus Dojkabacteria bacterium]|nr:hypothetical protein [Candidatus Dojkabacteria bacterium]